MDNPSPMPSPPVTMGKKIRSCSSLGIPGPLSSISTEITSRWRMLPMVNWRSTRVVILNTPLLLAAFTALRRIFRKDWIS